MKTSLMDRPTIMRTSSLGVVFAVSTVATLRPSRKHRHSIRDAKDFIEAMGHVDDAYTAFSQAAECSQQPLDIGLGQRCGRLVKNQDIGFDGECAADGDK